MKRMDLSAVRRMGEPRAKLTRTEAVQVGGRCPFSTPRARNAFSELDDRNCHRGHRVDIFHSIL
jgi:hypothetical protein